MLYFLLRNFAICFAWLPLCAWVLVIQAKQPGTFETRHIIITLGQLLLVVTSIVFELLTDLHTTTIIQGLNMVGDIEDDEWFQTEIVGIPSESIKLRRKHSSTLKLPEDVTGMAVFTGVFIATVGPLAAGMVILFQRWDPIYLLLTWGNVGLVSDLPLVALRWLVSLIIAHISISVCRYSILFYVYAGMVKYRMLNSMLKVNPNLSRLCVSLYNKLSIQMSNFKAVLILVSTGVLSVFFVGMIMGVNVAFLGILLDEIIFEVMGASLFMFSCGILQITFFFCCHIFEDSSALLVNWRCAARIKKDGGYFQRVVSSMRVIAIPAGNVGIFDKEIKMNYFDEVVNYAANVIVISKELFVN